MFLLRSLLANDRGGQIFLAVLAAVAILVPFLNLALPESNPLHVPTYTVTLLGKYLTLSLIHI